MYQEQGLIIFLCVLIIFLLWRQTIFQHRQTIREQHDKVILALLSYPVHQYTMAHMLERCLAIIFSVPQSIFLPKGAIFLLQNDVPNLAAQRGLTDNHVDHCQKATMYEMAAGACAFQFISSLDKKQSRQNQEMVNHGQFIVPLMTHNTLMGVLTLFTDSNYQATEEHIKYVKSLGHTIASLIERKQVSDELVHATRSRTTE